MRLFIIVLSALFLQTGWLFADDNPAPRTVSVVLGAATSKTNTINNLRGYLDEIQVYSSDGLSTGTVYLAYVPTDGIMPAVNVATGLVTHTKSWRPSIDRTDIAGVDLSNDPPSRVMLAGESLRLIISGSRTNKTWTATIKLDKTK